MDAPKYLNEDALTEYLNSLNLGISFINDLFPEEYMNTQHENTEIVAYSIEPAKNTSSVIERNKLLFYIRSEDPNRCVSFGKKLIEALNYKTNVDIGEVNVVLFKPLDTHPKPVGTDNNANHIYAVNILVVSSTGR